MSEVGKPLLRCMFMDIGFQDPEVAKSGAYTDALGEERPVMYSSSGYVVEVVDFMHHLCSCSLKIFALIYFISLIWKEHVLPGQVARCQPLPQQKLTLAQNA